MKRLLAIVVIAAFTGCGGGESSTEDSASTGDSLKRASDSVMQTGDTSNMSGVMGDSTSASGVHGAGSGSRVGGGVSGGAQGESSDSTKKQH